MTSLANNLGMEVGVVGFREGVTKRGYLRRSTNFIKKHVEDIGLPHVIRIYTRNQW